MAEKQTPENKSTETMRPLGPVERLALTNIFDTDKKRRAAMLAKFGYEMNPEDENEYRPKGAKGSYAEIDPGVSAYFKPGGFYELALDVGDIGYEAGVTPAMMAAGGMAGKAAPGPLGFAAGAAGRFAGALASEEFKKTIGDLLLDKDIPADRSGMVLNAFINSLAPFAGKAIRGGANATLIKAAQKKKDAILNVAKQAGGGLDARVLDWAANNPDMASKEATKGATEKLLGIYKNIFGMDSPLEVRAPEKIKSGLFAKKIAPLNEAAEAEIENLAKNPAANFKSEEITKPIQDMISHLSQKFDRSADEDAALKYLKTKLEKINSVGKESVKASTVLGPDGLPIQSATPGRELNFKEVRELLDSVQNDAWDREVPGNGFLKQVFGGFDGVRAIMDSKANAAGSSLPKINEQRSRILKTYNAASKELTPQKLQFIFVGDEGANKLIQQGVLQEVDDVLETKLTDAVKTGEMQRIVENLYKNPKAFGSGRATPNVISEALSGGVKGAMGGGAAGYAVGGVPGAKVGALAGGAAGAAQGASTARALSTPETALAALKQANERITELNTRKFSTPLSPAAQSAAQVLNPNVVSQGAATPAPKPFNLFDDDDETPASKPSPKPFDLFGDD